MNVPILTDWELSDLRDTFNSDLTQTCTLSRPTKDAGGISTGAHTVVAEDMPCLLSMAGGPGTVFNTTTRQSMTAYTPYTVSLQVAYDADVRVGDVVVVDGVSYNVTGTHTEDAGLVGQSVDIAKERAQA